ncbi:hypothetical protein ACIQGW_03865 [Lysinibacillus xylanilyticus]|uniref:hypothetical protein n=1 Tax=Lysinibacillus xylanilyticus TaxID=582475 RepID=UPI00381FDE45
MKNLLKIVALSTAFAFSMTIFASAESLEPVVDGNQGVSEVEDNAGVSTRGTTKPSTVWNLYSKGRYDFKGNAASSDLFTNYLLTGKSQFKIVVTNTNNINLKIYLKKKGFIDTTVWDHDLKPGNTLTGFPQVNSGDNYYLIFKGPSNFNGYIE